MKHFRHAWPIALALVVMGTNADAQNLVRQDVFKQDWEAAGVSGFTGVQSGENTVETDSITGNHYAQQLNTNSKGRPAWWFDKTLEESLKESTKWGVEFDVALTADASATSSALSVAGSTVGTGNKSNQLTYSSGMIKTPCYLYMRQKEKATNMYNLQINNPDATVEQVVDSVELMSDVFYHYNFQFEKFTTPTDSTPVDSFHVNLVISDVETGAVKLETKYNLDVVEVGYFRGLQCVAPIKGKAYNSPTGNSYSKLDNLEVYKYTEGDFVEVPTASITRVSGKNRYITMSTITPNAELSYKWSVDEYATEYPYEEEEPVVISDTTRFVIYGKKGANVVATDTLRFAAGTEIKLNNVHFTEATQTETGWSLIATSKTDDSRLIVSPTVAIRYRFSEADGSWGAWKTTMNGNRIDFPVGNYEAYAMASGYSNSDTISGTIFAETYNRFFAEMIDINVFEQHILGNASVKPQYGKEVSRTTLDGEEVVFYQIQAQDTLLFDERIGIEQDSLWTLRNKYLQNGPNSDRNLRLVYKGVKKGEMVIIQGSQTGVAFCPTILNPEIAIRDVAEEGYVQKYAYRILEDGDLYFSILPQNFFKNVAIFRTTSEITAEDKGWMAYNNVSNKNVYMPASVKVYCIDSLSYNRIYKDSVQIVVTDILDETTGEVISTKEEEVIVTYEEIDSIAPAKLHLTMAWDGIVPAGKCALLNAMAGTKLEGLEYVTDEPMIDWSTSMLTAVSDDNSSTSKYYGSGNHYQLGFSSDEQAGFAKRELPAAIYIYETFITIDNTSKNYPLLKNITMPEFMAFEFEAGQEPYEQTPDGIEEVRADVITSPATGRKAYDLLGRPVDRMTRGFYIIGGKKVLVK